MGRGMLTEKIQEMAKEFLGYEIDTDELRLIPYVHYCLVNEQKVDPVKMNREDRTIFARWKKAGHIDGDMTRLAVTKEFWDFMCAILFVSYVDINN